MRACVVVFVTLAACTTAPVPDGTYELDLLATATAAQPSCLPTREFRFSVTVVGDQWMTSVPILDAREEDGAVVLQMIWRKESVFVLDLTVDEVTGELHAVGALRELPENTSNVVCYYDVASR